MSDAADQGDRGGGARGTAANQGRHALLTNALSNWAGFAANLVVTFFLFPVLVRGLGEARYGIWSLVESILAYLMLFDLGVAASVVRYVARFEANGDSARLNRVFSTSLCIFAAAGACVLALALAGLGLLGTGFPKQVPPELLAESRWMLLILGFNLAVGLPLNVFPCVLDGLGRFPAKTVIRTAALLVRSLLFVLILRAGGGLVELGLTITGCNLLEHLGLALAACRYLPGLRFSFRLVDRTTFRTIRGYSLDAFLVMLAGRVSFQTDAIVIGAFLSPQAITMFAVAGRLVEYAKSSLRTATTVLTPAVSALEARGDLGAIRRILLDSTRWVLWLILPIQVGLLLLGRPFLTLWIGPDYARQSSPTLVILALPLSLMLSQSVSSRILYGIGKLYWFARLSLAEALANLALSLLWVSSLGVEGVALGTTVPSTLASLALLVYVCRQLEVGVFEYLWRSFLAPIALTVPLAAGWLAVVWWAPLADWPSLLATGTLGLAGYGVVAVLVEFGPRTVFSRLRVGLVPSAAVNSLTQEPPARPQVLEGQGGGLLRT